VKRQSGQAAEPAQRFTAALDALMERVKHDRSILAAVLCGSLSHDKVWDKSDIDLVLVTVDDKKSNEEGLALYADGINVHAVLIPRTEFRKMVEGSVRNGFAHTFLAKGRLLYTHDDSIARLCEQLHVIGERDVRIQLLNAGGSALPAVYKAHKWFRTRGDLDYTALWILSAANALARVEVLNARMMTGREVIPQALQLNPEFFKIVYTDLLNTKKTHKNVEAALRALDGYLEERAVGLFGPIMEYLEEVGEARSATEIDDHFKRNFGIGGMTHICEYLADQGLIGKASLPVRLTKTSTASVDELAFFYKDKPPDEW